MIEIGLNFTQVDEAARRLDGFSRSKRPLMQAIAGIMADAVEENFAQEGRPQWLGLAPATRKRRDGGKILQDSGRLASSIVARAEADSAVVGTNLRYAAIHQLGGEITRAAHSGWVRLRTDVRGNLLRQGKNSRLAVFAKDSHKRARTVRYTSSGSKTKIPARPFLRLAPSDGQEIETTVGSYLASIFR